MRHFTRQFGKKTSKRSCKCFAGFRQSWDLKYPRLQAFNTCLFSGRQGHTERFLVVDQDTPRGKGGNTYQHELASNGPYQFFAAFRNNELDYDQLYGTLPDDVVGRHIHQELAESDVQLLRKDSLNVRRTVTRNDRAPGPVRW